MHLTGLHVVLTYQCVFESGHCFIWGNARQSGIFRLEPLDVVLDQAAALGTIGELCYEGGETFVYYPILIAAVRHAAARRLRTAVVTNGYWANSTEQARIWLGRLVDAGLERIIFAPDGRKGTAVDLTTHPGAIVAQQLGLAISVITNAGGPPLPGPAGWPAHFCRQRLQQPEPGAPRYPWPTFSACPYTELGNPSHLHVDPSGNLHLCQGLVIGNVFEHSLASLVAGYAPERHALVGPLLAGGPAGLISDYGLDPDARFTDACQLCFYGRALLQALAGQNPVEKTSGGGEPERVTS